MESETQIMIEELKVIPWFDAGAWTPNRFLSCFSFFVEGEWHSWLPFGGKLQKMKMWPCEGFYFGDKPERDTDICFKLLHLSAQRASFTDTFRVTTGITNDLRNLSTSLAKVRLFYETSKTKLRETARFVETELEFMIYVCRSVFDLLQEMISLHWDRIELVDKSVKKKNLPHSFANVVFDSGKPRTAEELCLKFGLPKIFADWYVNQIPFFSMLRSVRDRLAHGGNAPVRAIFATEKGYALDRKERPWCDLYDWPKEVELQNELVPLRPVLCSLVFGVILATETFAQVFESTIKLPNPAFPGLNYYSRGFHDREFVELPKVLEHSWWCSTQDELAKA